MINGQGGAGYGVGGVGTVGDGLLGGGAGVGGNQSDGEGLAQGIGQGAPGGEEFLGGGTQLPVGGGVKNEDSGSICHWESSPLGWSGLARAIIAEALFPKGKAGEGTRFRPGAMTGGAGPGTGREECHWARDTGHGGG